MATVYDHLGNPYTSKRARAEAYGINPNSLNNAMRRGDSLDLAITRLQNRRNPSPVRDRLREEHIPRNLYIHFKRKHKDLTLDEIIDTIKAQLAYDHLGYAYRNEYDMARAWELIPNTYMHRFHKAGWSLEDALSIRYQGDSERLEKPKPQMRNRYSLFKRTKKTVD